MKSVAPIGGMRYTANMADNVVDDVLTKPGSGNAVAEMSSMVETIVSEPHKHTKLIDQIRHNWDKGEAGGRIVMVAGAAVGAGLVLSGLKHIGQGLDILPTKENDRAKYGNSIVINHSIAGGVETAAGLATLYLTLVSAPKFPSQIVHT